MNAANVLMVETFQPYVTAMAGINSTEVTVPNWSAVIHSELDNNLWRDWVATVDVFELEEALENIKAACKAAKGVYYAPYAQVANADGDWGLEHPTLTLRGMIAKLKAQGRKKVRMHYYGNGPCSDERIVVLEEHK